MKNVQQEIDKIFDKFWDEHEYADLHGININSLYNSLIKLGVQIDKEFKSEYTTTGIAKQI